jgi:hypothetical protein
MVKTAPTRWLIGSVSLLFQFVVESLVSDLYGLNSYLFGLRTGRSMLSTDGKRASNVRLFLAKNWKRHVLLRT